MKKEFSQTVGANTIAPKKYDFIRNNQTINRIKLKESNFTRRQTLDFPVIVTTILHVFKESVQFNISTILLQLGEKPLTGAAFSSARHKIKIDFFKEINTSIYNHVATLKPKLWKGYPLIVA